MAGAFRVTRREFLEMAGSAAALSLPVWYAEEYLAAQEAAAKEDESGSLRFGLIGCGGQGRTDAKNALRFGRSSRCATSTRSTSTSPPRTSPTRSATATSASSSNARTWTP